MDRDKLKQRLYKKTQVILDSLPQAINHPLIPKLQTVNEIAHQRYNRSTSVVKLPSLNKISQSIIKKDKSQPKINFSMKQISPNKSRKVIRNGDIEKQQKTVPTNSALTHLLKTGLLTVYQLVLLLKGLQREQFVYLKVKGIYDFQACSFENKGENYMIISGEGVISDGKFFTGQQWDQEQQLYKKLRKIQFWNQFLVAKSFLQWRKQLWRHINIISTNKLSKISIGNPIVLQQILKIRSLCLQCESYPLLEMLDLKGYDVRDYYNLYLQNIKQLEFKQKNLLNQVSQSIKQVALDYLSSYQFVPRQFNLFNKMLTSLQMLGLRFDIRNDYTNSLKKIYRQAKLYDLILNEAFSNLVVFNFQNLNIRVQKKLSQFISDTEELKYMRKKLSPQDYVRHSNSLLNQNHSVYNSWIAFEVSVIFDQLKVSPSLESVSNMFKEYRINVVKSLSRNKLKLVESSILQFVTKNIQLPSYQQLIDVLTFEQYMDRHSTIQKQINSLSVLFQKLQTALRDRLSLLEPLILIYKKYATMPEAEFDYFAVSQQIDLMMLDTLQVSGYQEGTWLPFGYLSYSPLKLQIQNQIKACKQKISSKISYCFHQEVFKLRQTIANHLSQIQTPMVSAVLFVKVLKNVEIIQEEIVDYMNRFQTLKRFNYLFQRQFKHGFEGYTQIARLLTNVKNRIMVFQSSKDNHISKYRSEALESLSKVEQEVVQFEAVLASKKYQNSSQNFSIQLEQYNTRIEQCTSKLAAFHQILMYLGLTQKPNQKLFSIQFQFETLRDIWRARDKWNRLVQRLMGLTVENINSEVLLMHKEVSKELDEEIKKKPKIIVSLKLRQQLDQINKVISIATGLKQIPLTQYQERMMMTIYPSSPLNQQNIFQKQTLILVLASQRVLQHSQEILDLIYELRKEEQIKNFVAQLDKWWDRIRLQTVSYNQKLTIFSQNQKLKKEIDDIVLGLIGIMNSRFGGTQKEKCKLLLFNVQKLQHLIEEILNYQKNMIDLYPAMTSEYCQNQLLFDSKKYETLLSTNFKLMKQLIAPTRCLNENTLNLLQSNNKQFQIIQNNLDQFLQKKRILFQRFYFLQDRQLIELLMGKNKNVSLGRMFEGIQSWYYQDGQIVGVVGNGNEILKLKNWRYSETQQIDTTFKNLEESIRYTLKSMIKLGLHKYQVDLLSLRDAQQGLPWICIYTIQKILFCKQIEINFLSKHSENDYSLQLDMLKGNLNQLIASPLNNSNLITVVIQQIHFTQELGKQNIRSPLDYQWQTALRYYYQEEIVMRCLGSKHLYGGEYQGVWQMMVDTKDIRRVHATVLSGLNWAMGTLIQGPSGTGKTETLKELARCMAKYCVILNCSTLISTKLIQKLLSGLCYTGSWVCFDQINRLQAEVMSVIASHILQIKSAILKNQKRFIFCGKQMKMRSGLAILCTMNPNYSDRTPLTDNLKQYFRYVTINFPEYQKIIQVMLYSRGFKDSSALASKINKTHHLLNIQFNEEKHYDFGLRAIKNLFIHIDRNQSKNQIQSTIVKQALFSNLRNSISLKDSPALLKTLEEVFPDSQCKSINHWLQQKYQSLQDSFAVGTIVLGKTSCKTHLINRYIQQNKPVTRRYNPNSLPISYFLGTKQMKGIIQLIAKQSILNQKQEYLLYLDSTIKSEWVQNLNTLLDSTRILTLPNGARIKLHRNFRLIMETDNLTQVSLATITRCNIIYVQPQLITQDQFIRFKIQKYNYPRLLNNNLTQILRCIDRQKIQWIFNIFEALVQSHTGEEWQYTEMIGVQRVLVYLISLLGDIQKIKNFLIKDLIPPKLPISKYFLSYSKYPEGEYVPFNLDDIYFLPRNEIHIPTYISCLHEYLIRKALQSNTKCVSIVGTEGCGKSSSLRYFVSNLSSQIKTAWFRSNKYLASPNLYTMIDEKFQKDNNELSSISQSMVPIENYQQLVIIIEDINFSSQNVTQMVRSFIETSMITDIESLQNKKLKKYLLVNQASCIHSQRLMNHSYPIFDKLIYEAEHQLLNRLFKYHVQKTIISGQIRHQLVNNIIPRFSRMMVSFSQEVSNIHCFSLRQAKQIAECFNLVNSQNSLSLESIMQIILYQINRIYHQRILNNTDRQSSILVFKKCFADYFNKQFRSQLQRSCKFIFYDAQEPLFTNISNNGKYLKVNDISQFTTYLQNIVSQAGLKDIYLSNQLTRIITKVAECKLFPGRNCFIYGSYGMGKHSVIKIVNLLFKQKMVQPPKNISKEDIDKLLFSLLGQTIKNPLSVVFRQPSLGWLNQIQNKFSHPIESLSIQQKGIAYQNVTESIDGYDRKGKNFQTQVKDYVNYALKKSLFIVISNSKELHAQLKQHRAFYSTLQISFLDSWSQESLYQISHKILSKSSKQMLTHIDRVVRLSVSAFKKVIALGKQSLSDDRLVLSPIHFTKFLKEIVNIEKSKLQSLKIQNQKLSKSITRVEESQNSIQIMKSEIIRLQPELEKKQQKLKQMILKLEEEKMESNLIKADMNEEIQIVEIKKNQMQSLKQEAQEDLNRALPLLNEALLSVSQIKRDKLSEIKATQHPHYLVLFTLQNLCLLLGEGTSWQNIRRVLWDMDLISKLKNWLPKYQDYIKVKKRIQATTEFNLQTLGNISYAAKILGCWVASAINYAEINHQVELKKIKLMDISKQLSLKQSALSRTQQQLKTITQRILSIQSEYESVHKSSQQINKLLELNKLRIKRSLDLESGLTQSKKRWKQRLPILYAKTKENPGNSFLNAAELELTSCYSLKIRRQFINYLKQLSLLNSFPFSQDYSILEIFDKMTIQQWQKNGLHSDVNSIQSAVSLIYHMNKFPILFDPQNQALQWLKKQYNGSITVTKSTFENSYQVIEKAIKQGHKLVLQIEGEQRLDDLTKQLIDSYTTTKGNRKVVQIHKYTVEVGEGYSLMFLIKSSISQPLRSLFSKHPLINFTISEQTLQDQLTLQIIKSECQGVYLSKLQMQNINISNSIQLNRLQNFIIQELANSQINLLDNEEVVSAIRQSISTVSKIYQIESGIMIKKMVLDALFKDYQKLTKFPALFYMKLKQMSYHNHMICCSYELYSETFLQACKNSKQYISTEQQNTFLKQTRKRKISSTDTVSVQRSNYVQKQITKNLSRGLSQKQCLALGFLLCTTEVPREDVHLFLQNSAPKHSLSEHITMREASDEIKYFYQGFSKHNRNEVIEGIVSSNNPYSFREYPISFFSIIFIMKLLKPERFRQCLEQMILFLGYKQLLDKRPSDDLVDALNRVDNTHPLLVIMGQDPLIRVIDYFNKKNQKTRIISLGQGQVDTAQRAIQQIEFQNVLILHNLHLSEQITVKVSKFIEQISINKPHNNFKLILISKSTIHLTKSSCQRCLKLFIQTSSGIKNQLKQLISNYFYMVSDEPNSCKSLAYSISFLHSVLNDRKQFQTKGWNHTTPPYSYSDTEYQCSLRILKEVFSWNDNINCTQNNADQVEDYQVSVRTLRYLIGQINYQGRVLDELDRLKIQALVKVFINQKLFSEKQRQNFRFFGLKGYKIPRSFDQKSITKSIQQLGPDFPQIFGMHPSETTLVSYPNELISYFKIITKDQKHESIVKKTENSNQIQLKDVHHELPMINYEIQQAKFSNISRYKMQLLSQINEDTKIFDLKAFQNPKKLFIEVVQNFADLNGIAFDDVLLTFVFSTKQDLYGIKNLKLEGGCIVNGVLEDGLLSQAPTIYLYPILRSKQKAITNYEYVKIPVFSDRKRQGVINSFGQNTNLLAMISIPSKKSQQFWVLRGTAFISQ